MAEGEDRCLDAVLQGEFGEDAADAGQPPVRALDRASLAVAAGELVAVVGPSRSGKSTLLHLMGILDKPARWSGLGSGASSKPGLGAVALLVGASRGCQHHGHLGAGTPL